ncbi:MAG: DUF3343 domain-containing protein [Clostridia bacterium]|nr:DUF3343 domain-containing protein [Clostridia bacterium]
MGEVCAVAAFRSRQQVMNFEAALRRAQVKARVISTPRDVAIGCGLSVEFAIEDLPKARQVLNATRPVNLIGIYQIDRRGGARPRLTALSR